MDGIRMRVNVRSTPVEEGAVIRRACRTLCLSYAQAGQPNQRTHFGLAANGSSLQGGVVGGTHEDLQVSVLGRFLQPARMEEAASRSRVVSDSDEGRSCSAHSPNAQCSKVPGVVFLRCCNAVQPLNVTLIRRPSVLALGLAPRQGSSTI
ncbi:hypothetical protein N658DRAFT_58332 [Parathielavia hyrcaniae]|uniref:Uncharacterized protein n=1 Tax=Parathielavia hyrcaniae TaxID=113614 RepID=A0AAN6Q0J6_9PEZI|nr:hypothetical protein N658DRAFT_58332 [Parathielavia hyrcaniae]